MKYLNFFTTSPDSPGTRPWADPVGGTVYIFQLHVFLLKETGLEETEATEVKFLRN